jgi:PhoD-like phosphatase
LPGEHAVSALLLGPLLRHVGTHDATIWVETGGPGTVAVRAGDIRGEDRTFHVAGHHYAIVVLEGLAPGSSTPYEVTLDGQAVWPDPAGDWPASQIRTIDPDRPVHLAFGSCREPSAGRSHRGIDPDVLDAYARRLATGTERTWPSALLLLGDQVYADDTSPDMRAFIASRRDPKVQPRYEVADFEEYARLYQEAWREPGIRWLLSTVPTSMIFDDHDIRDDWNTSRSWRDEIQATAWWDRRITSGLIAYWIYQHLGNLTPTALAESEILRAARAADDAHDVLVAFARHADHEADGAKGTLWSYRRDFGRVRLVVIDSRCGRILGERHRMMISDAEFAWVQRQLDDGDYDHLVVGTSMPWLLPRALHDIESWDEALAAPHRGRLVSGVGEWLRRAADLEHWAAFRLSFDRLAALLGRLGRGEHGATPPATICVLSGDVHHTYLAEADYPEPMGSRVYQVTCSPFHNTIPWPMRLVFHVGWSKTVEMLMRGISRLSGVPPLPIRWHHPTGPHFGNTLSTLAFEGRTARLVFRRSVSGDEEAAVDARSEVEGDEAPSRLELLADLDLTAPDPIT